METPINITDKEKKDPIFSALTHELRNILTMTSCSIDLIELKHPEVISFAHWSDIRSDFQTIRSLLQELSDYNNSAILNLTLVDLPALVRHICSTCSPWLQKQGQTLSLHVAEPVPLLSLDSTKISQLLINLIKNASEASSVGGHIHVSLHRCTATVQLKVSDNGCGISSEEVSHVFEAYHTTKPDGTGLGLPVSARIAQAHGGILSYTSNPGGGSCFTVSLPCSLSGTELLPAENQ